MKKRPVIFIAYKDYDNLGIGYMEAILSAAGFETKIINLYRHKADILRTLKNLDPRIIGFSVIFENSLDRFKELARYLRKEGITSHFTAGGHYASLKHTELFKFIPQLDSIVRFEGEYTMFDLVNCIYNGTDWRKIEGIAYRRKGQIISNKLRPLEKDLDKFPFPLRSPLREYAFKKKFATILAGRGCVHNCSFCNTRKFYSQPPGSIKRIRQPEIVVEEIEMLYNKKNCRIFLFEDDDFPVKTKYGSDWIKRFCKELNIKQLNNRILWKINCRPDEVDEETFSFMKSNGLFLVFIGIEEGTDEGLKRMNKCMTVSDNLEGTNILKKLGIGFDFGFMLFQPSTTYWSLNENLKFLRILCSDGYTPVTFDKMVPSYGTRVEEELKKARRLKISGVSCDYDFLDNSMNKYYDFINDCFLEWQKHPYGLANISKWARNYYLVFKHYFGTNNYFSKLNFNLKKIISESNLFFLDTMIDLSVIFESGQHLGDDKNLLENYRKRIGFKHQSFTKKIHRNMDMLLLFGQAYQ